MPTTVGWEQALSVASLAISVTVTPALAYVTVRLRLRQELEQGKELARHQARLKYESDAQVRVAEAVGACKSQILDAAHDLQWRLQNLNEQVTKDWSGSGTWLALGDASNPGHYFITTVYRFLRLYGWIEVLDRSLTYIDQSVPGADEERQLLNHIRFVRNALTAVDLFAGLDYDEFYESAHIFADNLRSMAEQVIVQRSAEARDGVMDSSAFRTQFAEDSAFREKFAPLVGLIANFERPVDEPLIWARFVAVHYAVARTLERFGYDFQRVADPERVLTHLELLPRGSGAEPTTIRENIMRMSERCSLQRRGQTNVPA